jgi:benzylsuccinate CoA-transferase BbsF subunit
MSLPAIEPSLPLAGVRVLDFGSTVAGPAAARALADFGAQVVKIESLAHPDTLRVGTPYAGGVAGIDRSGYFAVYNAGKLSIALDLRLPEAREVVRRLVEVADVVVENFAPGVMERWGFTYQQLSEWNPRVILASHCLQGQTGPHSRYRGYGQMSSGLTGWYDLTGDEGGEPLGPYSAYTDFLSWPYLVTAILVALEVREGTGRGQLIDHAQVESSLHFLAPLLLDYELNGHAHTRRGNREDYVCPNNTYPCAGEDRWVAITANTDEEWAGLCGALGYAEVAHDERFATFAARKEHEAELDALIATWTASEEPFALARRLQEAGVAAGVVLRGGDLLADPQLAHRGYFHRVPHAEIGEHAVHGPAFRVDGEPSGPFAAAPRLGEHSWPVCDEILGMTAEEFGRLAALGVFY